MHRDIKPSNLLLDTGGVAWITDFGLAKGDDEGLTQSGDVIGTIRYMAPERFRGKGDARADVYALGLTLYELLTLRRGFDSPDRLSMIEQIKTKEPLHPRAVDARIPWDLETIVLKAIEKDPEARYQSAEEMAEDLRRFLADEPIRARQVSAVERYWRWCQRNKAVAALLGGITLALVLGTAVSTHFALRATRGEWLALEKAAEARENARLAMQEARRARDAELESDQRLYVAEINVAEQAWQQGRLDVVQQALQTIKPKAARGSRSTRLRVVLPAKALSVGPPHAGWCHQRGVQPRRQPHRLGQRRRHGETLGRCDGAGSPHVARSFGACQPDWRSAPTAVASPRPVLTARSSSGTPLRGRKSSRYAVIRHLSWGWRSAPTAVELPRSGVTGRAPMIREK